jgi:acetyltransferase-like isoleucine patch superfamily enzyme
MNDLFKKIKHFLIFRYLYFIESKKKFTKGKFNKIHKLGNHIKFDYNIIGNNNSVLFDESKSLNCKIYIRGNNNKIKIDSNCYLKNTIIWVEGEDCLLHINSFTTIESAHIAITGSHNNILIGNDCMISTKVTIRTGDSHTIYDKTTYEILNYNSDVIIEDHVWIGDDVTILKGVNIGSGAIIGTKAVVTKNVPANSITAGIPSKVVKNNIFWKR